VALAAYSAMFPPQEGNESDFPDEYETVAKNFDGLGKLRAYQNDEGLSWSAEAS